MKALSPILFILIAILGFFYFVKPQYGEVKVLREKADVAEQTLMKVKKAQDRSNELVTTLNSFNTKDLNDLQKMLPDGIDTLRLVVDLTHLAKEYNTDLSAIAFQPNTAASADKKGPSTSYENTSVRFNVSMPYRDFISFMKDLERSLRLLDITSLTLQPSTTGVYDFTVSLKTYWLK